MMATQNNNSTNFAKIEDEITNFFNENFEFLKESSGHSLSADMRKKALEQVLFYYKKNKKLISLITRSEVKLSLPERETKNKKIPYTIEGVVDIVQENEKVCLYDLKTHDVMRIKANEDFYKAQLYIYAYIWKNLQGNDLDDTGIISTVLPDELSNAVKNFASDAEIENLMQSWKPIVPMGYSEEEVAEMIERFGETVEKIEDGEFAPPSVDTLKQKPNGMRYSFATHVCRNCDVRYSCKSFTEYLKTSRGASRNNMYEFINVQNEEDIDFIDNCIALDDAE